MTLPVTLTLIRYEQAFLFLADSSKLNALAMLEAKAKKKPSS